MQSCCWQYAASEVSWQSNEGGGSHEKELVHVEPRAIRTNLPEKSLYYYLLRNSEQEIMMPCNRAKADVRP